MKILHTADWHIGRLLYGQKRYDEFTKFLDWLVCKIKAESVDVLLIAGDIFDTSTPSNLAQELYYRFLCEVSASYCQHIVVIAGNHDSPSFLDAPKGILKALKVYVVGTATENPKDEVITLTDPKGQMQAIVCAVPYLRDRDIRTVEAGETIEDKGLKLIAGIEKHYADVCEIAKEKQIDYETKNPNACVPIIGMGHLFTAGGKTIEGDGVRELYVGSLAHVGGDVFPKCIDYLALGHLHIAQQVGNFEHIHYSGSPIPMSFGESSQQKKILLIEFDQKTPKISKQPVPCFQPMERIVGDVAKITERIQELNDQQSNAWLEIEYTGTEIAANLRKLIHEAIIKNVLKQTMEVRCIKNKRIIEQIICQLTENETLDDLDLKAVFERCLDASNIVQSDRPLLINSYKEIIAAFHDDDSNAD